MSHPGRHPPKAPPPMPLFKAGPLLPGGGGLNMCFGGMGVVVGLKWARNADTLIFLLHPFCRSRM
jgi:hypothetical protein